MTKRILFLVLLLLVVVAAPASASRLRDAAHATTELDVEQARELLEGVQADSEAASFERARLAMYRGDCDTASAILSAPSLAKTPDGARLGAVAEGCARVTAGALVVHDEKAGVWVRLQDSRDKALVPFITRVAAASRDYLSRELQVTMPRPLRIELVRDLFSLAAITGLPVEAAETTGTVGVARFGRVMLVSPRATPRGYPWEDTLAHEFVHLFVTRASRDYAPLWLQEGIAKMHETGWRPERPFDDPLAYERVAQSAQRTGRSIGLSGLGQSIALLPTPEMAAIAYAEVTSFMHYWVDKQGAPALRLLLADLRGVGTKDTNVALRSVTGYELDVWNTLWQQHLSEAPPIEPAEPPQELSVKDIIDVKDATRRARLSDLLAQRGHYEAAVETLDPALTAHASEPSLRWRAARARLALGDLERAQDTLGTVDDVARPHGPWFGLLGYLSKDARAREMGVAMSPLSEDVACQGQIRTRAPGSSTHRPASLPEGAEWRDLCRAAREIPID